MAIIRVWQKMRPALRLSRLVFMLMVIFCTFAGAITLFNEYTSTRLVLNYFIGVDYLVVESTARCKHIFFVDKTILPTFLFCFRHLVPPVIIPFDYPEIVNVGDALGLVCHISKGDEPISIKWRFRGFDDSRNIQINTKPVSNKLSILSIMNISASHSGTYTCTAKNQAGSVSYSTNVTVNGT